MTIRTLDPLQLQDVAGVQTVGPTMFKLLTVYVTISNNYSYGKLT